MAKFYYTLCKFNPLTKWQNGILKFSLLIYVEYINCIDYLFYSIVHWLLKNKNISLNDVREKMYEKA